MLVVDVWNVSASQVCERLGKFSFFNGLVPYAKRTEMKVN